MRINRIVALGSLLFSSLATAAPVFISDGAVHDVGTPTNDAYSVDSGTLNILPGAQMLSVSVHGDAAKAQMSGGQVDHGVWVGRGSLNISGGSSHGNDSSSFGGDGVAVFWSTTNISGGTFTGGNSPVQAGSGVTGSAGTADGNPILSTLNISGGTFIGGTGSGGYYGGTTGYSLISLGNTTVTGGNFLSPIAINSAYGGVTDFLGTNLNYHEHILSGILQNGDAINVPVYPDIADANVNDTATLVRFGSALPAAQIPDPPGLGTPAPVPEPSSALVFALLATLGIAGRRSRTRR